MKHFTAADKVKRFYNRTSYLINQSFTIIVAEAERIISSLCGTQL